MNETIIFLIQNQRIPKTILLNFVSEIAESKNVTPFHFDCISEIVRKFKINFFGKDFPVFRNIPLSTLIQNFLKKPHSQKEKKIATFFAEIEGNWFDPKELMILADYFIKTFDPNSSIFFAFFRLLSQTRYQITFQLLRKNPKFFVSFFHHSNDLQIIVNRDFLKSDFRDEDIRLFIETIEELTYQDQKSDFKKENVLSVLCSRMLSKCPNSQNFKKWVEVLLEKSHLYEDVTFKPIYLCIFCDAILDTAMDSNLLSDIFEKLETIFVKNIPKLNSQAFLIFLEKAIHFKNQEIFRFLKNWDLSYMLELYFETSSQMKLSILNFFKYFASHPETFEIFSKFVLARITDENCNLKDDPTNHHFRLHRNPHCFV